MLKSLRLQNFQSHVDSTIEFDPHFNCFIGVGNVGKTSIIRALNLLFYNQWQKSWVTLEASHCTITATLLDGMVLVRKKGLKINEYTVIYSDGKTDKYENFGTSIPPAIQDILKVFPIVLPGGEEVKLNLHSQFDLPILKAVSPADKAKLFGQLSGLDILDSVSQELSLEKKQTQSTIKLKEDELSLVIKRLSAFEKLPEFRQILDTLRNKIKSLHQQGEKLQELNLFKQRITDFKKRFNYVVEQLKRYDFVGSIETESIDKKLVSLKDHRLFQEQIQSWKLRYSQLQQNVKGVEQKLNDTKQIYVDTLQKSGLCPTCRTKITPACLAQVIDEL